MSNELQKIFANIDKLEREYSRTKRRNLAKKALKPYVDEARSKAPSDTGTLKLSIDYKIFRNNPDMLFAGPIKKNITISKKTNNRGAIRETIDAFYVKFIEFGYTHIAWPEKGKRIRNGEYDQSRLKEISPKPFLRPSWERTKNRCLKESERLIKVAFDQIAKKMKK